MQVVKMQLTKREEKFFDSSANTRFLSVDPLTKNYPYLTPYAFAENDVIRCIDLDGKERYISTYVLTPMKFVLPHKILLLKFYELHWSTQLL
jgi:hypothetical protein